jgi:hypothetical protein
MTSDGSLIFSADENGCFIVSEYEGWFVTLSPLAKYMKNAHEYDL